MRFAGFMTNGNLPICASEARKYRKHSTTTTALSFTRKKCGLCFAPPSVSSSSLNCPRACSWYPNEKFQCLSLCHNCREWQCELMQVHLRCMVVGSLRHNFRRSSSQYHWHWRCRLSISVSAQSAMAYTLLSTPMKSRAVTLPGSAGSSQDSLFRHPASSSSSLSRHTSSGTTAKPSS